MNKVNNQRRKDTISRIQKAYMNLATIRNDIDSITVSDVCKKAQINRTTFYSIYDDIGDLKKDIEKWMMNEFLSVYQEEASAMQHSFDFDKLFRSIKENQVFYKMYFKLGFDFKNSFIENEPAQIRQHYFADESALAYHIEFFAAGITAIVQKWLAEGCPGKPERMSQILYDEYHRSDTY